MSHHAEDRFALLQEKLEAAEGALAAYKEENSRFRELLKNADATRIAHLREQVASLERQYAGESLRRKRLLHVLEELHIPLPQEDVAAPDYASADYRRAVASVLAKSRRLPDNHEQHQQSQQPRPNTIRTPEKSDDKKLLECLTLLVGVTKFEHDDEASQFSLTLENPNDHRRLAFSVSWDTDYMDYSPVQVDVPANILPSFLNDSIDFRLNQVPVFFSQVLAAVMGSKPKVPP